MDNPPVPLGGRTAPILYCADCRLDWSTRTPIPMVLPVYSVVLGVGLSAAVGLFFGIYPARQAARLDPIEALRAEK